MKSGNDICSRDDAVESLVRKEDSYQEILNLLIRDVRRLPGILFLLERQEGAKELYHSCRELLPPAMERIWTAYEKGCSCGASEDGYEIILEGALQAADDHQLLRFAETGKDFRGEILRQSALRLMKAERWQAAFAFLAMIPETDCCTDGRYWYDTGRCLFHLGELEGAEACLKKALELQADCPPARAFLKWTREARG